MESDPTKNCGNCVHLRACALRTVLEQYRLQLVFFHTPNILAQVCTQFLPKEVWGKS